MFVGTSAMLIAACTSLNMVLPEHSKSSGAQNLLFVSQVALAAATAVTCALMPRRPPAFDSGRAVDRQYAVSIFERISFSWAAPIISSVISNPDIRDDKLPRLHRMSWSATLEGRFQIFRSRKSLTAALARIYLGVVLRIAALVFAFATLSFAPQFALFRLLRFLEARERQPESPSYSSWGWAATLGLCLLLSSTVETWLNWTALSRLSIPLTAQLSAAIFNKVTRIPAQSDDDSLNTSQAKQTEGSASRACEQTTSETPQTSKKSDAKETRSSSATLVAYDVQRISDFAGIAPMIPLTILKCVIACIFLKHLIGWRSMLAGLGTFLFTFPANIVMSSRYATAQVELMASRDSRTATTTEFLRGIQQIKLFALENYWQGVLAHARTLELRSQWVVFLWETSLIFVWVLAPVMLSAVSLATYVLTHESLPPSVAFTVLAVLGELEIWTALLPILSVQLMQSKASIRRIETFLNEPEVERPETDADSICFQRAALAWPSRKAVEHREAVLSEVTARIEPGELTLITGATGSGKSLFLAAILGECCVIEGKIERPRHEIRDATRVDSPQDNGGWLRKNTMAFVPQNAWIETGTLRENILFGLPYDEDRYQQVLSACALSPDLGALADGDQTNLASNRVNLSGGQKARVSLARALYSRADTLVMDDVLGGIDVRTRRHLVHSAIAGSLARGRTRILATHHLADCLKFSNRVYHAEDGRVYEDKQRLLTEIGSPCATDVREEEDAASQSLSGGSTHNRNAGDPVAAVDDERQSGPFKFGALTKFVQAGTGVVLATLIVVTSVVYLALFLGRVCITKETQSECRGC